jgi:hypothetical protein
VIASATEGRSGTEPGVIREYTNPHIFSLLLRRHLAIRVLLI